jgi:hypothetical protein
MIHSDANVENTSDAVLNAIHNPPATPAHYYSLGSMSVEQLQAESQRQRLRITELLKKQTRTAEETQEIKEIQGRLLELTFEIVRRTDSSLLTAIPEIKESFQQDRLWLQALVKLSAFREWALPAIIGLSLIVSAYTFRFLLRKKTFPHAERAHVAYLYVVGAALFFPQMAATTTRSMLDFVQRYDWTWYPELDICLACLLCIWGPLRLKVSARMLVNVLQDGSADLKRLEAKVANRLVISQVLSFLAIECLLVIVGVPILYVILKFQSS